MSFFDEVLLNIIFLIFPILCYFIFLVHKDNLNEKEKFILLDLVNITSFILLAHFSNFLSFNYYLMLLVNIPLLISVIYKRKVGMFILTILIIFYYHNFYNISFNFLILEHILYFVLYLLLIKKDLNHNLLVTIFTCFKSFILSFLIVGLIPNKSFLSTIIYLFLIVFIFYILAIFIVNLVYKTKEVICFHNLKKQLKKEEALKNALFQITHEVKNPLAVCKGYLQMMNNDEKIYKYLDVIRNEVDRTLNMLDDFGDYTKIKVVKEDMDLHMLLMETLESMEVLSSVYSLKINKNIIDDEIYIKGDYNRLKQVLVNIFKNALEASVNKEKNIDVSMYIKRKKAYIEIRDYGCGMDSEVLSNIGKVFYTTKDKGTGLGVSISKEIVELHNGSIKYLSKIGEGTVVILNFPCEQLKKNN